MSAPQHADSHAHWPHRRNGSAGFDHLPENPINFLAQLLDQSQRVQPSLKDCVGLASWCVAALEALVACSTQEARILAESSVAGDQMHALLVAAELLRSGKRTMSENDLNGIRKYEEVRDNGSRAPFKYVNRTDLDSRENSPPPDELSFDRSAENFGTGNESEAAKALLDFGRRVSAEEIPQEHLSRAEKRTGDKKASKVNGQVDRGDEEDEEEKAEHSPVKKKHKPYRNASANSIYDPHTRSPYMPVHNIMCDPLLSTNHPLPPSYYFHPREEMMAYMRPHQHHFSHRPVSYPAVPMGLMRPQHMPSPHMARVHSPYPPSVAGLPPAALPDPASAAVAATRRAVESPDLSASKTADATKASSVTKPAQKRRRLRFPEEWQENRPVHGSRYVYEGQTCRLQWEQDGKTFGFECFERLRCKFFDGRFSVISTGDIIQLQDSRVYVLLGAARDVVPRNHQYDTWMICYNFAGYRGMKVVFVELKWLGSVLSGPEEIPPDHPDVDYPSVEDVLTQFTKNPSFHRRHSIASARFRTSRSRKGRSGSKTSEEDEYNDSY